MSNVGKGAHLSAEENTFIPLAYEPSGSDVKFVGAMGYVINDMRLAMFHSAKHLAAMTNFALPPLLPPSHYIPESWQFSHTASPLSVPSRSWYSASMLTIQAK